MLSLRIFSAFSRWKLLTGGCITGEFILHAFTFGINIRMRIQCLEVLFSIFFLFCFYNWMSRPACAPSTNFGALKLTMANSIVAARFGMFGVREIRTCDLGYNKHLFIFSYPLGCLVFIFADNSLSGYKYSEFILYEVGHQ